MDVDLYELSAEEAKGIPQIPGSLEESLDRSGGRPRLPVEGRRLHAGLDRDVDRIQAGQRGRPGENETTPVRVRSVLPRLERDKATATCAARRLPFRVSQGEAMIEKLFDLTDRVAIVTGASSGFGVVFAHALAEAGADVVVAARRKERLEQTAQGVRERGPKVSGNANRRFAGEPD